MKCRNRVDCFRLGTGSDGRSRSCDRPGYAPRPPTPHGLCSVGTDPLGASPGFLVPASVLGDCIHVVSIQDPFNTLLHFSVRALSWGSSPGPRAPGPLSARMTLIFASLTELLT